MEVDSALGFGTTVTVLLPERRAELATEKDALVQEGPLNPHYFSAAH